MSTRTRRGALAAGAALCLAIGMTFAANPASAVHDDGLFELDGNAVDNGTVGAFGGDDWDVIWANREDECSDLSDTANTIAACSFARDNVGGSIFTTGGSKDEQEVSSWRHTSGSVPDKDDLLDAFAAQYENGNLYFGADRFATNGDAQIGFWFFHDEVSLNPNGTFSGVHTAHAANGPGEEDDTNGDILILSNFSNGGTVPTIRVFEWYGVNNVQELPGITSALCAPTLANDAACAITSSGGQTSPWPFVPKSGPSGQFGNGAFYEGGIDLATLGFGEDCFSTFLAETRSSTSITATLKDFVLGQLGECGATVTTQASHTTVEIPVDGTLDVSDVATIEGTGGVSNPNPTGTVDFHLCGPSTISISSCVATPGNAVSEDVLLSGLTNPAVVNSGPVEITSVGFYCWKAVYSGDSNYAGPLTDDGTNECFEVTPVTPTLTTTAEAGPVDLGDPISDVAHLTGTANDPEGNPAGGTITFALYGPDSASCAEADLVTTLGPFDVTGDGDYPSGDYTPDEPGVYKWIATYSGDSPNTLGDAGACGDEGESSTVNQDQPTMSTNQSWIPQDSVTIVAPAGGDLLGTVDFQLFTGSTCEGTLVYDELDVAVSGTTPQTVKTSNTGDPSTDGYTATATGEYSWLVGYDSDKSSQKDIAATCVEVSSLTIDNDNTD